jgi:hypothetical protein
MKEETQSPVVLKLSKNSVVKDTGGLQVYVVNGGGKIIETAQFNGGEAVLTVPKAFLQGTAKIYVAQALPKEIKESEKNELTLQQMNAYEAVKNVTGITLSSTACRILLLLHARLSASL